MFSRLLSFLILASTILSSSAEFTILWSGNPEGGNLNKCLDLGRKNKLGVIYDYKSASRKYFVFNKESQKVSISGTNSCLGSTELEQGAQLKAVPCDGAPSWIIKETRVLNTDLCMDLAHGDTSNSNPVLLWKCDENNLNQRWQLGS